jgi:hypothetical protein
MHGTLLLSRKPTLLCRSLCHPHVACRCLGSLRSAALPACRCLPQRLFCCSHVPLKLMLHALQTGHQLLDSVFVLLH